MRITKTLLKDKCENIDKSLYIGSQYNYYQIRERGTNKQLHSGTSKSCYNWLEGYQTALNRNSIG